MALLKLTKDKWAQIDDEDAGRLLASSWVASWHTNRYYAQATINRKKVFMHRFLTDAPPGTEVDHINGDGLDNRKSNLRLVTRGLNGHNRRGVKGYYYSKRTGKWCADTQFNNVRYRLGYFDTEEEARAAFVAKKKEILGPHFEILGD